MKLHKILTVVACSLLLGACSKSYPNEIKFDLFSLCVEGIETGQTKVALAENNNRPLSNKDIRHLCDFRVGQFMKEVPLDDFLNEQDHELESFKRAWRQKYVLDDVYNNLSAKDKRTFAMISKIIFGLDTKEEHNAAK